MTAKERSTYNTLWAFALLSIATGLVMRFAPPLPPGIEYPAPTIYDRLYFLGEQLCEVVLLSVIYKNAINHKIAILSKSLLVLSVLEMLDEVLQNNITAMLNDYAVVFAALIFIILYKRNGRHKA